MKVQTKAKMIGEFGCLFFCYLYCSGQYTDDKDAIVKACEFMDNRLLDADCTVLDADTLLWTLTGKRYRVTKEKISDISEIREKTPVKYQCGQYGHWVVVENGKIIFNSLDWSNCVQNGKPVEMRVINER